MLLQDENSGKDGRRYNEWFASKANARQEARNAALAISFSGKEPDRRNRIDNALHIYARKLGVMNSVCKRDFGENYRNSKQYQARYKALREKLINEIERIYQ